MTTAQTFQTLDSLINKLQVKSISSSLTEDESLTLATLLNVKELAVKAAKAQSEADRYRNKYESLRRMFLEEYPKKLGKINYMIRVFETYKNNPSLPEYPY